MKSRKDRARKYHRKNNLKLFFISSFILMFCFSIFAKSVPNTFAWLTGETTATGTIQNASTADLLSINGEITEYNKNCKLRSQIHITNISDMNITVTVELVSKNNGNHVKEVTLKPSETYNSNPSDVDNLPHQCDIKGIEYHITALNSYIDEIFTIPVDEKKMQQTKLNNNSTSKENQNPVFSSNQEENKEQPSEIEKATKPIPPVVIPETGNSVQNEGKQTTEGEINHQEDKQTTEGEISHQEDKKTTEGEINHQEDKKTTEGEIDHQEDKKTTEGETNHQEDKDGN